MKTKNKIMKKRKEKKKVMKMKMKIMMKTIALRNKGAKLLIQKAIFKIQVPGILLENHQFNGIRGLLM